MVRSGLVGQIDDPDGPFATGGFVSIPTVRLRRLAAAVAALTTVAAAAFLSPAPAQAADGDGYVRLAPPSPDTPPARHTRGRRLPEGPARGAKAAGVPGSRLRCHVALPAPAGRPLSGRDAP